MSFDIEGCFKNIDFQIGRPNAHIIHYGTEPIDGISSGSSLKRSAGGAEDNIREEGATNSKRTVTLTENHLGKRAETSNQDVDTMFDGVSEESVPKSNGLLPVTLPLEIPVRLAWSLPEESLDVVNSVSYDTIIPGGVSLPSDSSPSPANEEEELVTRGYEEPRSPETGELVTSGDFFSTAGGPVASSSSEYQYQGFVGRKPYNMTRFLETMFI